MPLVRRRGWWHCAPEFALCHDRTRLAQLGYAPLRANLVAGGLLEVKSIPGHIAVPSHCQ
jgi:hypothetical protein